MVLTEQQIEELIDEVTNRIERMSDINEYRCDGYQFDTDVDIELADGTGLRADYHYDIAMDEFGFDRLDIVDAVGEPTGELIEGNLLEIEKRIETKMFIERRDKWN